MTGDVEHAGQEFILETGKALAADVLKVPHHGSRGAAAVEFASAEVSLVPKTVIPLEGKNAAKLVKLLEALEEHDDVQTVYANFDIPTSVMEELAAA